MTWWCENPACGAALDPERVRRYSAKTCDAACRAAAFRARHGFVAVGERAEPVVPVRTARAGRYKPPGAQVSYAKAVVELADWFEGDGVPRWRAVDRAERILRPVLPAAQRARLEARGR